MGAEDIKEIVKEKYGQAALRVTSGGSGCCGAAPASGASRDPITSNLYDAAQAGEIPAEALLASLGCGNPTASSSICFSVIPFTAELARDSDPAMHCAFVLQIRFTEFRGEISLFAKHDPVMKDQGERDDEQQCDPVVKKETERKLQ